MLKVTKYEVQWLYTKKVIKKCLVGGGSKEPPPPPLVRIGLRGRLQSTFRFFSVFCPLREEGVKSKSAKKIN